jgi:hypothetical protein
VDIADVVSERGHGFALEGAVGFVTMKLLPGPKSRGGVLWDAGRVVPPGAATDAQLGGFHAGKPARLLIRLAPSRKASLRVAVNGATLEVVAFEALDRWHEAIVAVPASLVSADLAVRLEPVGGEVVVYHLWGLQSR